MFHPLSPHSTGEKGKGRSGQPRSMARACADKLGLHLKGNFAAQAVEAGAVSLDLAGVGERFGDGLQGLAGAGGGCAACPGQRFGRPGEILLHGGEYSGAHTGRLQEGLALAAFSHKGRGVERRLECGKSCSVYIWQGFFR